MNTLKHIKKLYVRKIGTNINMLLDKYAGMDDEKRFTETVFLLINSQN